MVLFIVTVICKSATSSTQTITAGQSIVIQGADYNSTTATTYSSDLANVIGNVSQRIVMEYADFNTKLGLNFSDNLRSVAANVTPRIIIEYADYASTNGFLTYLGPNPVNDSTPPNISVPTRNPSGNVTDGQSVIVSVEVSDPESGVKNATLQYNLNNGTDWVDVPMSLNLTAHPKDSSLLSYYAMIPGEPLGTFVRFRIVAWDYAAHNATRDGISDYSTYLVVPEFPSTMILSVFMIATLFAVITYRRRYRLAART
jgi:hypothetical protein